MNDKAGPKSELESDTPLYQQLADDLRAKIAQGAYESGSSLPSERTLSELTGMSRVTVRRGIEKLIDEGLLLRKHGSGTFVAPRIKAPASALTSFSSDARQRGEDPGVIWIIKALALPTDEEAHALMISSNHQVARLGRVRLSGGIPYAIEHAVVPAQFLPDLNTLTDSLYEVLAARGYRPVAGTQRIRASLATPTEAGILSIRQNSEVLRIERITHTTEGTPVEVTHSVYRGDAYEFVSDLKL